MYQEASKKIKETMKANNELVENTRISSLSNKKLRSDNKSGHAGITFKDNKWVARISVSGVEHYLGSFVTKEEAIVARKDGEEKYFKPLLDKYKK
ncbi:AP2 domain-containing protein [Listeria monocytogenes]|nr:AP2 domain-containing protein [Listeria monocytogenes]EHL5042089.1 AP2 domain-containing protein [Listeria monocytogenes]HAO5807796.1 AP2 domain-containing protein [Listeria monocytogenes]HAO5926487.1 AP2 domain-containing protein [Listeria monocytogenes]HAO5972169.1 AP2 domain-containing protein [Listeria monocytogenes]